MIVSTRRKPQASRQDEIQSNSSPKNIIFTFQWLNFNLFFCEPILILQIYCCVNYKKQSMKEEISNTDIHNHHHYSLSYRVQEELNELQALKSDDINIQYRIIAHDYVHLFISLSFQGRDNSSSQESLSFAHNLKKTYFSEFQFNTKLRLQFLLVIHPKYPLSPPLLLCISKLMFPRLDDYRDYLQDVLNEEWWPSVTLKKIISKLQAFFHFSKGVSPMENFSSFSLGSLRAAPFKHCVSVIEQYATALQLCEASVRPATDLFAGKWEQILLGLSWSNLVLFQKISTEHCTLFENWPLKSIKKIQIKKTFRKRAKSMQVASGQIQESYEIKIKFFNPHLKGRVISIREGMQVIQQEDYLRNASPDKNSSLYSFELSRNQIFEVPYEGLQRKRQPTRSKIRMLRHMAQFVQLREFIKNSQESTEYKISMISQAIQKIADQNDAELLEYYRRKLKEFINIQYGCWEISQTDNATIKFDFD